MLITYSDFEAFYIQYLHFSFQLTYVTADFNNTPPAEAETPRNENAVEYTGVQFAQAWGCKQGVQGTHTYTLIAGMLKIVKQLSLLCPQG